MRTALMLLTAALAIGTTACKKAKDKEPPPVPTGSGSATAGSDTAVGSGSDGSAAAAAAGSGSGSATGTPEPGGATPEMARKAGNCPSTVFGAITTVEVKGKEVVLTIQSEDKDAVVAIQRRTESLLKEKNDGGKGAAHDQKGTHGGGMGLCPVFFGEGGKATAKEQPKGVAITITPKEKPEELKATIDDRIAKAAAWVDKAIKPADQGNAGGVGGGKGEHGSTHQGQGDAKGKGRKDGTGDGKGTGGGGGAGTGGGGGKGTGGGSEKKPGG